MEINDFNKFWYTFKDSALPCNIMRLLDILKLVNCRCPDNNKILSELSFILLQQTNVQKNFVHQFCNSLHKIHVKYCNDKENLRE